jgi:hypothetical protein
MPVSHAVLGHVDVAGQRRAAERAQVERQDDVAVGEQRGDPPRAASSSTRCRWP